MHFNNFGLAFNAYKVTHIKNDYDIASIKQNTILVKNQTGNFLRWALAQIEAIHMPVKTGIKLKCLLSKLHFVKRGAQSGAIWKRWCTARSLNRYYFLIAY